eukprot:205175_1
MVLADLGSRITGALHKMRNATVIDKDVLNELLKEVGNALVAADVNFRLVVQLKVNVSKSVNLQDVSAGSNKRILIQKSLVSELTKLLDPGKAPFEPKKGKPNVIMFVGLQGAGKTTSVTKMAWFYQRKGWKTAIVCADTFRAGAFDQVKQNCTKARIPFYGSYTERDPVQVAVDGVERFKADGTEIIIVDTSGRHKQEAALFEEMKAVARHVQPDDTVFVMDSSIGQAARDQAQAFNDAVDVGSVIITKLDGHAKGGGALSAVAATKSPIIFIGTGEHIDQFEKFDTSSFVSRLLGMGDIKGMVKLMQETDLEGQQEMIKRIGEGKKLTLRDMRDQFQNVMKMGPISNLMSMIPGLSQMMPQGADAQESSNKLKQMMTIMDSMTDKELDSDTKIFDDSRILRIARGAGVHPQAVQGVLTSFKPFQKMGGSLSKMGKITKGGDIKNLDPRKLSQALDPNMLKQMGGQAGLNNLLKQLQGGMGGDQMKQMMKMAGMGGGFG